jgi:antitoxin MazE
MKTKVAKWGNSYAVRLPKQFVQDLQLNDEILMESKGDMLILRKPSKEAQLKELLKDMKPQEEVDWGQRRGKEVW